MSDKATPVRIDLSEFIDQYQKSVVEYFQPRLPQGQEVDISLLLNVTLNVAANIVAHVKVKYQDDISEQALAQFEQTMKQVTSGLIEKAKQESEAVASESN